jgi:hypothetical protein
LADSIFREERTGAIAGIDLVHELSPGIRLSALECAWRHDPPSEEPIVLSHSVGDVSVAGMHHVMDIGMRVSYFTPNGGGSAIRIKNLEPRGPVHLVRVLNPGRKYAVNYEFVPPMPAYRRDVEIISFAHALTVRGTRVMAHGCGLAFDRGVGAICLGTSGVGKSTAARMLSARADVTVLNDDRLVIEQNGERFRLWATPWPGTEGVARNGDSELRVIALIGRDSVRSARMLTGREALTRLLPTLALPIWDHELMERALSLVDSLLERVPVIEMRYPLGAGTSDWIAQTLQATGT